MSPSETMRPASSMRPLREVVLEIAVAQVEGVVGRAHAGRIGVPVEQVERQRILAAHVVVDDIGPDQVAGAQHVEGRRHLGAFEVALLVHRLLDRRHLVLVDEHFEVAGMGEIDLRGEERDAADAVVAFRAISASAAASSVPPTQ